MRFPKSVLFLLVLVLAFVATSAGAFDRVGGSLGYAVFTNPATAKTLASTPTTGVTIPAGTKTVLITIETAPMRYTFGSVTPTGSLGQLLPVGQYTIDNNPTLINALTFITDASGASKMTVEFLGQK